MTAISQSKDKIDSARANGPRRDLTEKEVAQYTADIMMELRQLAKSVRLETLQTLIELVYYEAYATANPLAIPEDELKRVRELEAIGARASLNIA